MLEQQLAERFRAVVDDEPPLALDPDELVDRLRRTRRRRLGVAATLGVVMATTVAVGGAAAAGGLRPTAQAPEVTIAATVPAGAHDVVPEQREHGAVRFVRSFLVDAAPTDTGTLEIRRDDDVLFRAELAMLDAYDYRPIDPVVLKPGQRVLIAVSCRRPTARECRVDVTFSTLVTAR